MTELLTNEEIDSLLAMFRAESGAEVPPEGEAAIVDLPVCVEPEVVSISPLDLLKPNRFGRDRLVLLERLFASAAKSAGALLTERLRIDISCDCVAVEQIRFSIWRRQLEGPIGVWSIVTEPFQSPVVLTMTSGLVRGVVDRLLGGSGRVTQAQELFTSAELAVAEAIVEPLFGRLLTTFQDVISLRPTVEGRSSNPATLQAMAPSDVALSVYFQVGGEVLHGDLRLAIAFGDLEPFLDRVAEGVGESGTRPSEDSGGTSIAALCEVPLAMSVVLGSTDLSLRALLGLCVGDVVRLDRAAEDLFEGQIEGTTKLRGEVERRGSARIFRVEEVPTLALPVGVTGGQT